jgi:predicted membrane protein
MMQDNIHSCRDYLNDGNCIREDEMPTTSDEHVSKKLTAEDRAQIVDLCYSLIDLCQLARLNLAMAMSLADRFMSNPNRFHISQFTPSSFSPQEIRHFRIMFQFLAVSAL